jgi:hypothetical protein
MTRPPTTTAELDLKDRLVRALEERDAALTELARARAELDALKQAASHTGEAPPPLYPDTASPGAPPPLRYVLTDLANDAFKRLVRRVNPGKPGGRGAGR